MRKRYLQLVFWQNLIIWSCFSFKFFNIFCLTSTRMIFYKLTKRNGFSKFQVWRSFGFIAVLTMRFVGIYRSEWKFSWLTQRRNCNRQIFVSKFYKICLTQTNWHNAWIHFTQDKSASECFMFFASRKVDRIFSLSGFKFTTASNIGAYRHCLGDNPQVFSKTKLSFRITINQTIKFATA